MQAKTLYAYTFSRCEDVRNGRLDRMPYSFSLAGLDLSVKGRITVPSFVGVYQIIEAIPETKEERCRPGIPEGDVLEVLMRETSSLPVSDMMGLEDSFSMQLIHIGYDPKVFDKNLATGCFGNMSRRIRVSPYDRLPNFKQKDISLIDMFVSGMKEIFDIKDSNRAATELRKLFSIYEQKMRHELNLFGLTQAEYVTWVTLNNCQTSPDALFRLLVNFCKENVRERP